MWKKRDGFLLIEVLVSLAILFGLVLYLLPQFVTLQKEHKSMRQIGEAVSILDKEVKQVPYKEVKETMYVVSAYDTQFLVENKEISPQLIEVCVSFADVSRRVKERCSYAKYRSS